MSAKSGNGAAERPIDVSARESLGRWESLIDKHTRELEPRLIEIRRHLHAHPEPSGEERNTSRFLFEQLTNAGTEAVLCRDGVGVIANLYSTASTETSGPLIAIRADLDALRIQDAKEAPYASQTPGLCHACGHDAHATMVFGAAACAAACLREVSELPGVRLRFLFQPAEETSEGARWMVEQGALDGVSAILAIHVDPERPLGTVGLRAGTLTANCDEVEIVVEGKGGHSARPHHTLDPIAAAAQLACALYQVLPRSVDSRNASVFSIGKFAGGTLPNVIPERVEIRGTLRTLDAATRATLKSRIEDIVHGIKEMSGTSIQLRFLTPIDSVYNDPQVTAALEEAARSVLGPDGVQTILQPSMGGEDFSGYLTRVPGALIRIGCAPPGFAAPFLHAPDFDIDERVLALGTRILLRAALLLATKPHAFGQIATESYHI